MSLTARDYLISRFTEDARALHERVSTMRRGTKVPGPDAATSERMADACEDVIDLLEEIGADGEEEPDTTALAAALVPQLEARMKQHQAQAAVRSVYAGAIARLREVEEVERRDESR